MSWIVGNEASNKIIKIHTNFTNLKLKEAKDFFGIGLLDVFHPILCSRRVYSKIPMEDIILLQQHVGLMSFSTRAQSIRKRVYENFQFLDWFSNNIYDVCIEDNFIDREPTAVSEVECALSLVERNSPWISAIINEVVKELCFCSKYDDTRFVGGSSDHRLIGTIFCSLCPYPDNILDLAISLVHEVGHQSLIIYQLGQDPISEQNTENVVYSGVRKTLRPIYGSFHAVVALGFMVSFCYDVAQSKFENSEVVDVARARTIMYNTDLKNGLAALRDVELSELGVLVVNDLIQLSKKISENIIKG